MNTVGPPIGAPAPDFELLDSSGAPFRLYQNTKTGHHTLLILYRGHW